MIFSITSFNNIPLRARNNKLCCILFGHICTTNNDASLTGKFGEVTFIRIAYLKLIDRRIRPYTVLEIKLHPMIYSNHINAECCVCLKVKLIQ